MVNSLFELIVNSNWNIRESWHCQWHVCVVVFLGQRKQRHHFMDTYSGLGLRDFFYQKAKTNPKTFFSGPGFGILLFNLLLWHSCYSKHLLHVNVEYHYKFIWFFHLCWFMYQCKIPDSMLILKTTSFYSLNKCNLFQIWCFYRS